MSDWQTKKRNQKIYKKINTNYRPQDIVKEKFKIIINNLDKQKVNGYIDMTCKKEFDEVSKYGIQKGSYFVKNENADDSLFKISNQKYTICRKSAMSSLIPKEVKLDPDNYKKEINSCNSKCEDVSKLLNYKKMEKCYKKCKYDATNRDSDKRVKILEDKTNEIIDKLNFNIK